MIQKRDYFEALDDMSKWIKSNAQKDKYTYNAGEIQKAINSLYKIEVDNFKKENERLKTILNQNP